MHCQYFETGVYKYDRRNLFAVCTKKKRYDQSHKENEYACRSEVFMLTGEKKDGRVGKKYHTVVLSAPGRHFKNQEDQNPKLPCSMKK